MHRVLLSQGWHSPVKPCQAKSTHAKAVVPEQYGQPLGFTKCIRVATSHASRRQGARLWSHGPLLLPRTCAPHTPPHPPPRVWLWGVAAALGGTSSLCMSSLGASRRLQGTWRLEGAAAAARYGVGNRASRSGHASECGTQQRQWRGYAPARRPSAACVSQTLLTCAIIQRQSKPCSCEGWPLPVAGTLAGRINNGGRLRPQQTVTPLTWAASSSAAVTASMLPFKRLGMMRFTCVQRQSLSARGAHSMQLMGPLLRVVDMPKRRGGARSTHLCKVAEASVSHGLFAAIPAPWGQAVELAQRHLAQAGQRPVYGTLKCILSILLAIQRLGGPEGRDARVVEPG